jgi:hypothetical protein
VRVNGSIAVTHDLLAPNRVLGTAFRAELHRQFALMGLTLDFGMIPAPDVLTRPRPPE